MSVRMAKKPPSQYRFNYLIESYTRLLLSRLGLGVLSSDLQGGTKNRIPSLIFLGG